MKVSYPKQPPLQIQAGKVTFGYDYVITTTGEVVIDTAAASATGQSVKFVDCSLTALDARIALKGLFKLLVAGNLTPMEVILRDVSLAGWTGSSITITLAEGKVTKVTIGTGSFAGATDIGKFVFLNLADNQIREYVNLFEAMAAVTGTYLSINLSGGTNRALTQAEWALVTLSMVNNTVVFAVPPSSVEVDGGEDFPAVTGTYVYDADLEVFVLGESPFYITASSGEWWLTNDVDVAISSSELTGETWYDGATPTDVVTTLA